MRRVFAVAALLLAASCGGSMSPTASTPVPALPSGAYVLSVSIGGGVSIGTFTISVCQGSPGLTNPGDLATNVELQHNGNTVTIQPDDSTATFRMDLQMTAAALSGTASGQFLSTGSTGTVVAVVGQSGAPATAVGTATGSGAGGNLTGGVGAGPAGGTVGPGGIVVFPGLSCNAGNWTVTPR